MRGRPANSTRDLREACLAEALGILAESGVEALSLREVARRLNVSHQAPYRHFESRDHLLVELVGRAFEAFTAELENRTRADDPLEDLGHLGRAYLRYAASHPLHYRLMFGTAIPHPEKYPEVTAKALRPFAILREAIARVHGSQGATDAGMAAALFVWSTVHGMATLHQTGVLGVLGLDPNGIEAAGDEMLAKIGHALAK